MMWFQDGTPGIVALAMTAGRHAVLIKTMIGLVDGLVPSKWWRSLALNVVIRGKCSKSHEICARLSYAPAFRGRRHYLFRSSVRLTEAWETKLFSPVHGSVGPSNQPWSFCGMSVGLERFPTICWRTQGGNGLKFGMLMYLGHIQNWLDYGHGLLIILLLAPLWLSEIGQIWGFRPFPGECMERMASNFSCWCILTTIRTD